MKAILPSGDVKEFEGEVNLFTIAKSISNSLAKKSVAAKVNDELVDMSTVIDGEARVEFITPETEEGEEVIRHSTAHLMAQAVVRLFPGTKVAIGPAIENGFYYDFDPKVQFTEEDLAKIEAEMKKIVKENEKIERIMMTREEAIKHFEELGEEYKVEIIKEIAQGEMFTEEDIRTAAKVCVIGSTIVENLFPDGTDPIGKVIRFSQVPLRVVGILESKGYNSMGMDQDDVVLAPYSTVMKRLLAQLEEKYREVLVINAQLDCEKQFLT